VRYERKQGKIEKKKKIKKNNITWLSWNYNKKYVGFMAPLAKKVPDPWFKWISIACGIMVKTEISCSMKNSMLCFKT